MQHTRAALGRLIDRLLPDTSGEEAHRARLLTIMALVLIVGSIWVMAVETLSVWLGPTAHPQTVSDIALAVAVLFAALLILWLNRAGHTQAATWLMIGSILACACALTYLEGSPPTDVTGSAGFLAVIALAPALLEKRRAWLVFAAACVVYVGLYFLWLFERLPPPIIRSVSSQMWIVMIWGFAASVVMGTTISGWARLRRRAEELEQRVAERTFELEEANEQLREKIAEQEQAEDALRQRQQALRMVIFSMPNILLVVDEHDRLSAYFIPPHLASVWDISELSVDRPLVDVLPGKMADQVVAAIAQVRGSGEMEVFEQEVTLDGATSYLEVKILLVTDSNDLLLVLDDITKRKQAEAERERLIEDLDAFAHTVAHDIRNPLQQLVIISGLLEMMWNEFEDQKRVYYLRAVTQGGKKLNNIIESLMVLSGVRRMEVELQPLDMERIVSEAQQRLSPIVEENQAEIILPDTWPTATGYGPWVEEVWVNYVSKGIKYGGQPPRVELGATEQPDGMVRFWVRDNGDGITQEDQARLFAPFTQLSQVSTEGHGLGLSIVRRIMERLGGEVGIESEVGKGSMFYFTLPE